MEVNDYVYRCDLDGSNVEFKSDDPMDQWDDDIGVFEGDYKDPLREFYRIALRRYKLEKYNGNV